LTQPIYIFFVTLAAVTKVTISVVAVIRPKTLMAGKRRAEGDNGQEPGTTKRRARLRAQRGLMRVSCGEGFGTRLWACRKKESCRASTVTVEAMFCRRAGSISATEAARSITAPMPTVVMICASLRNSAMFETGKVYLQEGIVSVLKCLRRLSNVATWTCSCCQAVSHGTLTGILVVDDILQRQL